MFRTTSIVLVALAVLASTTAAQSGSGATVGLGLALNPFAIADLDEEIAFLPFGFGNFTIPIQAGDRLRIEPELGYFRARSDFSGGGFSVDVTESFLRYGLALHFLMPVTEQLQPYWGPRVGFVRQSSEQLASGQPANESSRTDHYLGLAIGGEYWFTSRVSLSGEVQVNRVGIGDVDDGGSPPSTEANTSFISTNGVIAIRLYIF